MIDATDTEARHLHDQGDHAGRQVGPDGPALPEMAARRAFACAASSTRSSTCTSCGNGKEIHWTRDPVEVFAYHIDVPSGVKTLDVGPAVHLRHREPTRAAIVDLAGDAAARSSNSMSLYPAGYFTRPDPGRRPR